ncbi:hypothetical protein BT69DRAFT_1352401 [Atractiella rhizophila]|nr:hypothetical protein BT69DRAFT_1352401 [Atractiella rhizophila]
MAPLSLSPSSLLLYETLTLTSLMRRNSRWASGSAVARSLSRPELAGEMGLRRGNSGLGGSGSSGSVRKDKGLEREEEAVAYEALVRLREEVEGEEVAYDGYV